MEFVNVSAMENVPQDQSLVSVLMSTYKEPEEWLRAALKSVLSQTYRDLELIVIVDMPGKLDHIAILKEIQERDSRLKYFVNDSNEGLAFSLNRALELSRGQYIARMDADDVMLPNRLELQVDFLRNHPEISLVGSSIELIDKSGDVVGDIIAIKNRQCKKGAKYKTIAFHPTWLMRRQVACVNGGYSLFPVAQDFDFLLRAHLNGFLIGNLNAKLLKYRVGSHSVSAKKAFLQSITQAYIRQLRIAQGQIEPTFSMAEYELFLEACESRRPSFDKWNARYIEAKKKIRLNEVGAIWSIAEVYLFSPVHRELINQNILCIVGL